MKRAGALVWLTLLLASPAAAQSFPAFTAPVVDAAEVVPDDVERTVGDALDDYRKRTGNQIAVAVVRTTGGRSIEDYSIDLARAWGVGEKDKDNGVLLVIAYDDRKLRIEVGLGLEGTLTDLEAGRIIRDRLVPLLREGQVGAAVEQGALAIRAELGDPQAEGLEPVASAPDDGIGAVLGYGLVVLMVATGISALVAVTLASRSRRGRTRRHGTFWGSGDHRMSRRAETLGWLAAGSGSSFGDTGGGGGGFGGVGGGGFGGGGASGGW